VNAQFLHNDPQGEFHEGDEVICHTYGYKLIEGVVAGFYPGGSVRILLLPRRITFYVFARESVKKKGGKLR